MMAVRCDFGTGKMARGQHTPDEGLVVNGTWWHVGENLNKRPLGMGCAPQGAPNLDVVERKMTMDDCRRYWTKGTRALDK